MWFGQCEKCTARKIVNNAATRRERRNVRLANYSVTFRWIRPFPRGLPGSRSECDNRSMDGGPFPEDIVAQGSEPGPRFTSPGWRPSRAAGILSVVTLLAGLAVGYAIGNRQNGPARTTAGTPAARSTAVKSAASPAGQALADIPLYGPALTEEPGTCSTQVGRNLELGIPVTNMSQDTVLLQYAEPVADMPSMLRVLSWHWAPCGFDGDGIIPDTVTLGPGETTWLTATVKPLVACPAASPLQFRVTYSVNSEQSSFTLPGFSDLTAVRYSGCKG